MRISDILAPYKTDSRVVSRDTAIPGLYCGGRYREVKYVSTHMRTGDAGMKNCEVMGSNKAMQ